MKRCKRISALLALLLAAVLAAPALAAGSVDLAGDVSLAVTCRDGSTPLVGMELRLYQVATMDETGDLTTVSAFQGLDLQSAQTLAVYAQLAQLTPADTGATDSQGKLTFPTAGKTLTPGLYLLTGSRHTQGGKTYDPTPYLVKLPTWDQTSGSWAYQVDLSEKFDIDEVPDTPVVPATVTRKVLKVWDDAGCEGLRPESVTVYLLRNGQVYRTVTLSAANNWRYTWTGLDAACQWTVAEQRPQGYEVSITQAGVTFVVTNSRTPDQPDTPDTPVTPDSPDHPDSPDSPDHPSTPDTPDTPVQPDHPSTPDTPDTPVQPTLPQTGQLWWPVPVLLCAGLGLIVVGLVRRRGDET